MGVESKKYGTLYRGLFDTIAYWESTEKEEEVKHWLIDRLTGFGIIIRAHEII